MANSGEGVASFYDDASHRRRVGATLCWIAVLALIILLFVPRSEGIDASLLDALLGLIDLTSEIDAVSGVVIGILVLYIALIVGAAWASLYTMIPLSALCIFAALGELSLINSTVGFLDFFGILEPSGIFNGLELIAAVLAVASIIARYAMSNDAPKDNDNKTGIALVQLNTGKHFDIPGHRETVIGKSENADIVISNPAVSRTHAKLFRQDDAFIIVDLNSRNGTYIGDDKLPGGGRAVLKNGDYITLGNEMFEVQMGQNAYGRR